MALTMAGATTLTDTGICSAGLLIMPVLGGLLLTPAATRATYRRACRFSGRAIMHRPSPPHNLFLIFIYLSASSVELILPHLYRYSSPASGTSRSFACLVERWISRAQNSATGFVHASLRQRGNCKRRIHPSDGPTWNARTIYNVKSLVVVHSSKRVTDSSEHGASHRVSGQLRTEECREGTRVCRVQR
jgi:hypothetical protein